MKQWSAASCQLSPPVPGLESARPGAPGWFVHRCYKCVNGNKTLTDRSQALQASGTVTVGVHSLYFYNDPLLGWCNAEDKKTGCKCK